MMFSATTRLAQYGRYDAACGTLQDLTSESSHTAHYDARGVSGSYVASAGDEAHGCTVLTTESTGHALTFLTLPQGIAANVETLWKLTAILDPCSSHLHVDGTHAILRQGLLVAEASSVCVEAFKTEWLAHVHGPATFIDTTNINENRFKPIIDRLRSFKNLQPNWNGYDAVVPTDDAVEQCISFLQDIWKTVSVPTPMVSGQGEVGLLWEKADGTMAEVGFLGDDHYGYLAVFPDGQSDEGEGISSRGSMPSALLDVLRLFTSS